MEIPKSVLSLIFLFIVLGIIFVLLTTYKFGGLSNTPFPNNKNEYAVFIQKSDIPYSYISTSFPRESQIEVSPTYYKFLLSEENINDLLIKTGYDKFVQLPRYSPSNSGVLYRIVIHDNVNIPKIQELIKFSSLIQPQYDWVNMMDKSDTFIVWVEGELPLISDDNGVIKNISKYYNDEKIDPDLLLRFTSQEEISNIILFLYDPNQTRNSSIQDEVQSYGIEINEMKYVQNSNNTQLQQFNIKAKGEALMQLLNNSPYVVLVY